jgi:hypothetical protein
MAPSGDILMRISKSERNNFVSELARKTLLFGREGSEHAKDTVQSTRSRWRERCLSNRECKRRLRES